MLPPDYPTFGDLPHGTKLIAPRGGIPCRIVHPLLITEDGGAVDASDWCRCPGRRAEDEVYFERSAGEHGWVHANPYCRRLTQVG